MTTQSRTVGQHVEVPRVGVSLCQLEISVGLGDVGYGVVQDLFAARVGQVDAVVVSKTRGGLLAALLDQFLLGRPHDFCILVQVHVKFGELGVDSLERSLYS